VSEHNANAGLNTPSEPICGYVSYLFSSIPLVIPSKSALVPLSALIIGYNHVSAPPAPEDPVYWETWQRGRRVDSRASLFYGRVFLPKGRVEGLYLRRSSPTSLFQIRGVSDDSLPNGGNLLGIIQTDAGRYSTEFLLNSDSALLGLRGIYNFGPDPRDPAAATRPPPLSLFSMGFEAYYGILNKAVGMSTGLRFTTLPTYHAFPYTMTLTLNPLMGNLSSSYSVKAGKYIALCSQFDFNYYSYESGFKIGCELWRLTRKQPPSLMGKAMSKVEQLDIPPSAALLDDATVNPGLEKDSLAHEATTPAGSILQQLGSGTSGLTPPDENVVGVLKAKIDQNYKIGLMWEGRFKELLYTVGTSLDFKRRERMFTGLGIELRYAK
jgi:mitochondrial distribution and morphology protein 10